ncbi:MAG: cadherin-like domain-containing protein [Candidatus Omnitrophica bacterium]|nr:cadherin-like domain-containing protein [Candidatus Omnitrophota bacterium]
MALSSLSFLSRAGFILLPLAVLFCVVPISWSQNVTATLEDNLQVDNNMNSNPDGGDTLRYTLILSNTGVMDATGVIADVTLDLNTLFVTGSIYTSPIARKDVYSTTEDAMLVVAASGVLTNDNDLDGSLIQVATAEMTSASGAVVKVGMDGSLMFTPGAVFQFLGPTQSVTDTFSYTISDASGNLNSASVCIVVSGINDAPSFTKGPDVNVFEDGGMQTLPGWATNLDQGQGETGQNLTFNVTGNTNMGLFSVQPAISSAGDLTFTPAPNQVGSATITAELMDDAGTANGGSDTSPPQSFLITIDPVNDEPSFAVGADQAVLEDAGPQTVDPWATGISRGPADEAIQTVTFEVVGNTNSSLFAAGPAVSSTGVLTFTTALNQVGSATITLQLVDSGGTANGGDNTSATASFVLSVTPVNDEPSFMAGANQQVLEDSGPHSVSGWATSISSGPADESAQTVTFNITGNTSPALFAAGPAVSPTGTLTYEGAMDASGTATITVEAMDNGGTANGGDDTSPGQMFTITFEGVNDAPSFAKGPDVDYAGPALTPHTVSGWATSILAGPANEAAQALIFNVTSASPELFSTQPAVNALSGDLTFTATAEGVTSVTVELMDDGGTANGGVDLSGPQVFTITTTFQAPPMAVDDPNYNFVTGGTLTVPDGPTDLLANDDLGVPLATLTSFGGGSLGGAVIDNASGSMVALAGGTLTVNSDGSFTLTTPTAPGVYTFIYRITNIVATSDATATIEVREAPTAVDDPNYATLAGVTLTVPDGPTDLLANDALGFPPASLVSFGAGDLGGTVIDHASGSTVALAGGNLTVNANGSITLATPTVAGTYTFDYQIQNVAGSDVGSVTIQVQIAPTAVDDPTYSVVLGNPLNVSAGSGLLANDDLGLPAATLVNFGGGSITGSVLVTDFAAGATTGAGTFAGGTLTVNSDGSFAVANPTVSGTHTFQYRIQNVAGFDDATATVIVNASPTAVDDIVASNSAPGDKYHTGMDAALMVADGTADLLFNDALGFPIAELDFFGGLDLGGAVTDNASGTTAVVGASGSLQVNGDGTLTFIPDTGFVGEFSFMYRLRNATGIDDGTVTLAVGNRPVAVTDTYPHTLVGNVPVNTAASTNFSVLTNDSGDAITASLNSDTNGTATVNSNGTFTFNPDPGYEGAASFTYDLTNGFGTVTGTVNLMVNEVIWFVDNEAMAGGDGRLNSPFNQLTGAGSFDAGAADEAGDNIFLYSDINPYSGGLTLLNNQKLIGQGSTVSLATAAGVTFPADSSPPSTGGSNPTIANGSGVGVTLGSTNTIRGLSFGACSSHAITGANFGTLTVNECAINNTDDQALNLNTGTLSATFSSVTSTNSAAQGINLVSCGGTLTINGGSITLATGIPFVVNGGTLSCTYSGGITQAANNPMASISGGHSTGTITFQTGTLSASMGTGLQFDNADGTYNFNGTTTLNGGDAGIDILSGSAGAFTFGTGCAITSPTGIAFNVDGGMSTSTAGVTYSGAITQANNAAMVNVSNHNTGTITFQTGTLSATNGTGLQFSNADSTTSYNFNGTTTLNGGDAGIDITTGSAGTFTFGANTSINNPSGIAYREDTSTANVTYNGTITKTNNANHAVDINAKTGGTTDFNGQLNATTSTANAIDLTNTGGTVRFDGGMTVSTTSGVGFNATGSGATVIVTDPAGMTNNTLTSTTGTALNVANTTIGAGGLTFESISANGASSGIVLNNTGSTAGLTVTGTGSANSGGTIQNTTGPGISLTSTTSPSFTRMNIQSTSGSGVQGTGVVNFTFTNSTVNNSGTGLGVETSNIAFNTAAVGNENNLSGVVTVTGNTLTTAYYHGIDIFNFNGTISDANLSNNTITSTNSTATSKGSGIRFVAFGSASTVANVTKATIDGNIVSNFPSANGIQAQGGNGNAAGPAGTFGTLGSGTNIIAITNNRVAGFSAANRIGTQAILAVVNGKGQGNFNITSNGTVANPITNVLGTAISVSALGEADVTATVNNNVIVANNAVGAQGIGAGTSQTFAASDSPSLEITANNNNISQTDGNGILVTARDATAIVRAKIQNNTVAAPLGGVRPGIRVDAGNAVSVDDSVCLNISGNTSAGSGGSQGIGLRKQGTVSTTNDFGVNGMAATSTPGVEAYVDGLNPAGGGTLLISATSGFTNCSFP